MHIGMILSTPLPPTEGIGFYCWSLARYLVRQGHQVTLITRGSAKASYREVVDGITIWRARFLPVYPLHVHLHSLFVDQLVKELDSQVDVWHLHTPLVKLPKTQRPVLLTVHSPMASASARISAFTPLGFLIKLQTPISIFIERKLFRKANKIVSVASSVAQELQGYGVDIQKVAVVGNGAETSIFSPGFPSINRKKYFLTAGRLAPAKGLQDLLKCAEVITEGHPDVQFYIAGSGPLLNSLQEEIGRRNLQDRVILLGHVSDRKKMAALYQNAIAYIHPSHYEGLPTVLLEAMACGRPVITTAVSGALDVVEDGVNGLLVPPRDPEALANAVKTLLDTPTLGEKLGQAACETIRQCYSWEVISKKYLAQYQALLEGDRR